MTHSNRRQKKTSVPEAMQTDVRDLTFQWHPFFSTAATGAKTFRALDAYQAVSCARSRSTCRPPHSRGTFISAPTRDA